MQIKVSSSDIMGKGQLTPGAQVYHRAGPKNPLTPKNLKKVKW